MKAVFGTLGRVFLSLIFLSSAFSKIINWEGNYQYLMAGLNHWLEYTAHMPDLHQFIDFVIPVAPILLIVATIFEGLGGLFILLGLKPKMGAFLLIVFLIPSTLLFHAFWIIQGPDHDIQMIMFLKNLSILGGLFLVLAYDGKKPKKPEVKA